MSDHSGWRVGAASAPVHHGEILQGVFDSGGVFTHGLVTLPCTVHRTRATFIPAPGADLVISPAWKTKAERAARLTLEALGSPDRLLGGSLKLTGDVPLSRGFGSSTSDVLATIRAVQDALTGELSEAEVARLAVRAETASDSLMFDSSTVLFAQRAGEVIEDFGSRLPVLRVLGFGSRPEEAGQGVDTLTLRRPPYDRTERGVFADLQVMLREAIRTNDAALVGTVATVSAQINQRHLPIPAFDRIRDIARASGALGLQAAHSGDIAGLLFDADGPEVEKQTSYAQGLLHDNGIHEQWIFTTDGGTT